MTEDGRRITPDILNPRDDVGYTRRLERVTVNMSDVLNELSHATHPRLKHPFHIFGYQDNERVTDLSVDPNQYRNAQFKIAVSSDVVAEEGTDTRKVSPVTFGYNIGGEMRRIGPANYMALDTEGNVEEVGFGGGLVAEYFRWHLYGREFSEQDRSRNREINKKTFDYLRKDPEAKRRLKAFAVSREWPDGLEDVAQLAYFHANVTPLKEWATAQGFTDEEMYMAGWYELSFSNSGNPSYTARDSDVIRIPYFTEDGEIDVWRTRHLKPSKAAAHKYTSWPLDRSLDRTPRVEEKLYNGYRLAEAEGQTVVITEGEFKCLVATEMNGILTVGIPGITEVDDLMIEKLVEAHAKDYVVILDRDPKGKGLMRVDGITDSDRAAYMIAKRLQESGAESVRVGTIPDARMGEKVGLDDLILDKGPAAMNIVVDQACEPDEYARLIRLNPTFVNIFQTRQKIRKTIEHYENSVQRGGNQVDLDIYDKALQMRDAVDTLYADYLSDRFRGARRIDQPPPEVSTLFRARIPDINKKIALTSDGRSIPLELFEDDKIYFQLYPSNVRDETKSPFGANLVMPFTTKNLNQVFRGEHDVKNKKANYVAQLSEQGVAALGLSEEAEVPYIPQSKHEFNLTVLAGYLAGQFPTDEYVYYPDISFYSNRGTFWDEHVSIPLTIARKSSGAVVAFGALTDFDENNNMNSVQMQHNRTQRLVMTFLRRTATEFYEDKVQRIYETITPHWTERNLELTGRMANDLGITDEMVLDYGLTVLQPSDYDELIQHFSNRQLLNQATNTGLFRTNEDGKIVPRFAGPTMVMPVTNQEGNVFSFRVFPFVFEDHLPPASNPDLKLVRYMDGGGRHLQEGLNPDQQLYMHDRLSEANGKHLIIAHNEIDGLILGGHHEAVVALNSSFQLHPDVITQIAASKPREISIVISGRATSSEYDMFAFDGVPGFVKELVDLQTQLGAVFEDGQTYSGINFSFVPTPLTVTREDFGAQEVQDILNSGTSLSQFLKDRKFNTQTHSIVQKFTTLNSRLREYLEIAALPDMLDARPIDWWVRENERLYKAIKTYAQQTHGVVLPTLEEFMQEKLGLDEQVPLAELVRQRSEEGKVFISKPVYSTHKHGQTYGEIAGKDSFQAYFAAVLAGEQLDSAELVQLPTRRGAGADHSLVAIEDAERQRLVELNPVGTLNHLRQSYPGRVAKPVVDVQLVEGGGFSHTVTVMIDGNEFTATASAARKKDAQAIATMALITSIEAAGVTFGAKKEGDVFVENPKGKILEMLQQEKVFGTPPEANIEQTEDGFVITVSLMYGGRKFEASGQGSSKKEAERLAYTELLGIIEPVTITQSGSQTPLQLQVEQALTMKAGDKDYISRLMHLAQISGSMHPEFTESEGEDTFLYTASITLNDVLYTSEPMIGSSKKSAKQMAANNLLSTIYNAVSHPQTE